MSHQPSIIEQRIEWTHFQCATDKTVLKALARWYCWRPDGTNIRPSSLADLAEKSGVSERTLDRALHRLVVRGWLEVTMRRHNDTATYRINVDRLATQDPDQFVVVADGQRATVARSNVSARHYGALDESGALEKRPESDKVARSETTGCTYVPSSVEERSGTGDTHTPAATASTFRHPNHAYCGVWFCVPTFLDQQFDQQLGGASASALQQWYRGLNAQCIAAGTPIGDALKWLRARFAAFVRPQQLSFGPLAPSAGTPPRARPQPRDVYDEAEQQQRRRGYR